ncbi:MAG: alcohol dehydrogenase, partial [Deltaproteobacteria bacterium]|nr:alcohol dehydrogenase [Deltaproteobacteria bacterium]
MAKPKIALVTGGGTGIGKAIAAQLAKNGASVAIASRSRSHIEATVAELSAAGLAAFAVQMDVRNKSDVERGIEEIVA